MKQELLTKKVRALVAATEAASGWQEKLENLGTSYAMWTVWQLQRCPKSSVDTEPQLWAVVTQPWDGDIWSTSDSEEDRNEQEKDVESAGVAPVVKQKWAMDLFSGCWA